MQHLDHGSIANALTIDFAESNCALRDGVDGLRDEVLQPPAAMDPITWMFENIELPKSKTERSGQLQLTGYQREFVRLYFLDSTNEIDVTKGTRVGLSLLLSAMAAYILAYLGESVTIAQPTDDDALAYYRERIEPLFEMCPKLGALRRTPRRGESQDSWNLIEFKNGAVLRLVGAASDDNFRRYGSKHNWGDEYSAAAWAPRKGSQGTKADLFAERGGEFTRPKLVLISSPTSKGECRTTERHAKSNRCEPWTACPHCREPQVMEWGDRDSKHGFKFARDENGFVTDAWYRCAVCGEDFREHDQMPEQTINGRTVSSVKEFIDATTEYRPAHTWEVPGRVGMYVPQWLSFSGQANWRNLAQSFLTKRHNPEEMKTWVNNVRGVAYDDFTTSGIDGIEIAKSIVAYPAEVPDDVVVLTAGVDTQTNKEGSQFEQVASREVSVVGWTRRGQMRTIGHWVIEGAPGDPASDKELIALLDRRFANRAGYQHTISAVAIDLGGHFADETRLFTAKFPANRSVWAIKGRNNAKGTRSASVWPKKASKSRKLGVSYYVIDSQLAKDAVFRLVQLRGDNMPMFPKSMPHDYLDKLLCEERKKISGGFHWQPKQGARAEEEWACLAYAYAALKGLQTTWLKWRDLNLAGDKLGIPELTFDPETGEIGYDGDDLSVHAVERKTALLPLDQVGVSKPTLASAKPIRSPKARKQSHPQAAKVSPNTEGETEKRRPGTGARVRSSKARRWG
ncbi:phage terminase large subunit GpA protein [Rhizobium sp. Kim5]|uniref:terminase gpA endonuclease subunit n=1 Tax=Rhizobium sp. Kim5 TaxID=2020311 RepID=UPI000A2A1463|nr:terminase gpA endonuclease subunit [Rhizobium sp. Kim5]ARQ56888.1 phage terminase large subunit GpA protein [Rhizobium sp. Kim5]